MEASTHLAPVKTKLIRLLIWASTGWAILVGLEAARCLWMCYTDPYHRMGMKCWFSQLTGLPCDYGTFGLLVLLAVAGTFIANAASIVAFIDHRG